LIAAAVIGLGILIFKNFDKISESLKSVFVPISEFMDDVLNAFVAKITSVFGAVNSVVGFVENAFLTAGAKIDSFLGIGEQTINQSIEANQQLVTESNARADVNVNLRAPAGVVESVKTNRSGDAKAMNLGVNMAVAG